MRITKMINRAGVTALFAMTFSSAAMADGLIDNVNGITLGQDGKIIRFTALLIDEAGKVTKLITAKNKKPKRPDWRHDGRGLTMLPGFIDAQGDIMALGFQALTLDLSHTKSLSEAQAAVAAYHAEFPGRKWILGYAWDQSKWNVDTLPSAIDLDTLSDKPIWLIHSDGSAGWANSAAMKLAGISARTKIGVSGRIEMAGGKPTGILAGSAMELIQKQISPPRAKDRDIAFAKAQEMLLSQGITSSVDIGTDIHDWQAFRRAGDSRRMNMRIFGFAKDTQQMELIAGARPTPWLYGERLRLGGLSINIDGGLASRTAWLKSPYADAPKQRGVRQDSYAELRNTMVRASMDEFQISLTANGDAAVSEAIGAIADLAETFPQDRRWRIAGLQMVDPSDLAALKNEKIITVIRPGKAVTHRETVQRRLGDIRANAAYSGRSLGNGNMNLAFGSGVMDGLNPFEDIAAAITREDSNGQPFGGWRPGERQSREQALSGLTQSAARSAFAEAKVGTLAPGLNADFILVDTDPMLAAPAAIRQTRVLETWVAGRPVFKASDKAQNLKINENETGR